MKRALSITAAISLLLFTACGGGNNSDAPDITPTVSISITQTLNVHVGETKTLNVTRQNTNDFTVSVSPASGSGCAKSANDTVVCAPTAAGKYTVTVEATADTSKKSSSIVTVPELEIFGDTEITLYADETESEEITFNAGGDWTATLTDSAGGVPDWITISNVTSNSVVTNSIDAKLQTYDAASISGQAGYNSIILTLQPNDSGADRSATLTIATANGQMEATITQVHFLEGDDTDQEVVSISIDPPTASVTVGESRTFTVERQNTDDFTMSVNPTTGSGCVKNGNDAVVCTPTAAGTYTITVTATANISKNDSAAFTVNTIVPDLPLTPQIAAGQIHTMALKSDGSLWAWGNNECGQLGDGTNTDKTTPTRIGADADWAQIAAGGAHTIALKSDGSLWAWGWNEYGQLGDGTITDRTTPTRIGADTDWTQTAAGNQHTIALKSDGSLWAWGCEDLDRGCVIGITHNSPIRIGTDTDWMLIDVNNRGEHIIALKSDGSLWAWGNNYYGQLGDGSSGSVNAKYIPTRIGTDTDWTQIAGGKLHTIALKSDGSLWAWGDNRDGQLGDGTTNNISTPTRIDVGMAPGTLSAAD